MIQIWEELGSNNDGEPSLHDFPQSVQSNAGTVHNFMSRFEEVIVDGVWIGNWIY
jgi:hypothetical protein